MAKIIKLEYIATRQKAHKHPVPRDAFYCSECGEGLLGERAIEEYICGGCRHLVGKDDKFCLNCGEPLQKPFVAECHDTNGAELSEAQFKKKKAQLGGIADES